MDFALPHIGEGVNEAELVRWLVAPGDSVKRGQTLLEVMTDKATMEVPSPFAGTIGTLKAEPGQVVQIGQAILDYSPAGQSAAAESPPAAESKPARAPARAAVTTTNGPAAARTPHAVRAAPSVRQM